MEGPFVCRAWRVEDGLPQNSVWAIQQTRDGYLWIGTGGGLARFDGVRFKFFGMPEGLPSLHVRALLETRDGALWVGTARGLCRYADGKFTTWTTRDGLAGESVVQLAEDGAGDLWIGTTLGVSRRRDDRIETLGAEEGLTDYDVRSVATDGAGNVWVSLVTQGLVRWERDRFVLASADPELRATRPFRVMRDRAGRMWATGVGQVHCITGDTRKTYGRETGLPAVMITCLAEGADGTIWAGTTDQGLYFLREGRFHAVRQAEGLSDDAARVIAEDREGNVWVGTRGGGLNRLRPRRLNTRRIWSGATEAQPVALVESPDGAWWVGTIGHGLFRLTDDRQEPFLRNELARNHVLVTALLVAQDGGLWCGGGTALYSWKDNHTREFNLGGLVRCLSEDGEGGLWVGCQDGALWRLRDGAAQDCSEGLPRVHLNALVRDCDGALWVGTYGGGLVRLKNGQRATFGLADGLRSDLVRTLCLDADDELWIGTEGGGLSRLKAGRIFSLGKEHGLPDETILQILDDGLGGLWLGSHRGIFQVSRQELEALAAGTVDRIHPRVFGRPEGMGSEQCAGGPTAGLRTRSGLLAFATGSGIVVIDPKAQKDSALPPAVRLETVVMDGHAHELEPSPPAAPGPDGASPKELTVAPGRQRLEFHYTGLFFSAPDRVRFRHRLDGLETEWTDAESRRVAYYNYLPPGRYRFRVSAHNGDGAWSEPGAAIEVRVLPHFWQTWWFLASSGLVLLAGVAGAARYVEHRKLAAQLRRLELDRAMERERTRIARDIHDDLGARLTKITMLTEQAEREIPPESPPARLTRGISQTAREMLRQLDETVWAVNPRNDQLDRLAEYLLHYAEEFFRPSGIRCRFKLAGDVPPLPLAAEPRHHVFLAFKETLNNVARHSGATEVEVQLEWRDGRFWITVRDNGRGFDAPAALARGRGLDNIRSRLENLGGRFVAQTQPGAGSVIQLDFSVAGVPPGSILPQS